MRYKPTGICLGAIDAGSDRVYVLRKHTLHRNPQRVQRDDAEHAVSQRIV